MIWKILLVIYICWSVYAFFYFFFNDSLDEVTLSLKEIYEDSGNLNWLGSCFVWLLFFLANPFGYVFKFIGWIFTVGRKNDKEQGE
jgi:hypothetical protein